MTQSPNFISALHGINNVALVRGFDAVEANTVVPAAHERNVFGMRPAKRHCRASRATTFHPGMGQIVSVPYLLCDHTAFIRKVFDCGNERFRIAPRSQLVMAAFSG